MGWLTTSFEQYTLMWVVLSALAGGLIGSFTKFLFEDILRPWLGWRRDGRQLSRTFTRPLERTAESLERQINNFVRNVDRDWYRDSEYYKLSTLYAFAEFLAWVQLLEKRLGFVAIERSRSGRRFNHRLNGLYRALTSFRYFRWVVDQDSVASSAVPRRILGAIGEIMIVSSEKEAQVYQFSDFCVRYSNDAQFANWFKDLDRFLLAATPSNPLHWDRLIAAGVNLRLLVGELSPKVARRQMEVSNLDLTSAQEVKDILHEEVRAAARGWSI